MKATLVLGEGDAHLRVRVEFGHLAVQDGVLGDEAVADPPRRPGG